MTKKELNSSYIGARVDIQSLIPANAKSVLDVGCSVGSLGAAIKMKIGSQVIGIELSEEMAEEASGRLDRIIQGDVAEVIEHGILNGLTFDTIIFADILEHLVDPWKVLKTLKNYLIPEGIIIASVPNVRHIDTVFNLVFKGYWPYRERGIHDATHLRFFTKKNVIELFRSADLDIASINANYRLIEKPHVINTFAKYLALPVIKNFIAFQYLVTAHHREP